MLFNKWKMMIKLIRRGSIFMMMVFMVNCSSLKDSIQARKLLGNCEYELKEIRLKAFDFSPIISFNDGEKTVNIEEVKLPEILVLLNQIRKGEFSFSLKELKFDALVEVNNPNGQEVILDSMELKLLLDESFLLNLNHNKNVTVPANSKAISTIGCNLPLNFSLNKLLAAKEITLDGSAFMKVNFSKRLSKEIKLPIKVTREIPREQIKAAIAEGKEKIIQTFLDKTKVNPQVKRVKDLLNIKGL